MAFFVALLTLEADEKSPQPKPFKHQITGLFAPYRVKDLEDLFQTFPGFKLKSVDYANAEAVIEYDPNLVFPGAKPEKRIEDFNSFLRGRSLGTFGIKPLRTVPLEKLKEIEVNIEGLDCKGCTFAVYDMIYKLPGVEKATASFKTGKLIAQIDPTQISEEEIEKVLKRGGVTIKPKAK